ncbi:MAG: hypothetical protein ABIP55_14180 [Tepidisphaeraceae bacterium]
MFFVYVLAQSQTPLDQFTSLGAAGLMGAMWLWERRTSQKRETQIDEAHARILGDRVAIDQLMNVVRQNAEAIARLCTTQDQLLRELNERDERTSP